MISPAQMYQAIQPMMRSADPADIRRTIENVLELFPDFARGHNDLGVLLYQADRKQDAHRHYERAAQLEPDNVTYQKNLADFLYVEMNRMEDALRIYVRVLELKPDDVETLLVTGHICVACHKFDDAMTFYRRVLELEPGNTSARDYLEKLENHQGVNSGADDPETLMVCYGSTYGVFREVVDGLRTSHSIAMLHFSEVYPFPLPDSFDYIDLLENAELAVCVELNATGQFARLMRAETGFTCHAAGINRFDGRPFSSDSLHAEVMSVLEKVPENK